MKSIIERMVPRWSEKDGGKKKDAASNRDAGGDDQLVFFFTWPEVSFFFFFSPQRKMFPKIKFFIIFGRNILENIIIAI